MARSWTDIDEQRSWDNAHQRLVRDGHAEAHMTEREVTHELDLHAQDRAEDKRGRSWGHLAYVERPAPRERREHFDETRVRALLHPRSGRVEVQPRGCPVCGDPTGVRCCTFGRDVA